MNAEIHIQKSAPGPPAASAVATPAIFPVPTVAARAVHTDWSWLTAPALSPSESLRPPCRVSASLFSPLNKLPAVAYHQKQNPLT